MAQRYLMVVLYCTCLALACSTIVKKDMNITITVPDGTQTHDDPKQLCPPTKWSDYLIFYFGNYFAHAATVQTYPEESAQSTIKAMIFALLFPASGVLRGLTTIFRHAIFEKTELQKAARAGALCMVIRSKDWRPSLSQESKIGGVIMLTTSTNEPPRNRWYEDIQPWCPSILRPYLFGLAQLLSMTIPEIEATAQGNTSPSYLEHDVPRQLRIYRSPWARELCKTWDYYDTSEEHVKALTKIHGFCRLSKGYALAHVPRDAVIEPLNGISTIPPLSKGTFTFGRLYRKAMSGDPVAEQYQDAHTISASYNFPKAFLAVVQLAYASFTLYQTFGGQVETYGFAAFGLSVTPYALMSLVNLIGRILTPTYPALYLVRSSVMTEAELQGSKFDGAVGRIVEIMDQDADMVVQGTQNFAGKFSYKENPDTVAVPELEAELKCKGVQWPESIRIISNASESSIHSILVPSCPYIKRKRANVYFLRPKGFYETTDVTWTYEDFKSRLFEVLVQRIAQYSSVVVSSISLAIVGGISKFHSGGSSSFQQIIMISWLTVGIYRVSLVRDVIANATTSRLCQFLLAALHGSSGTRLRKFMDLIQDLVNLLLSGAPSGIGFVLVGLMIHDYGTCIQW